MTNATSFIDHDRINSTLAAAKTPSQAQLSEILARALELKGLSTSQIAQLLQVTDPDQLNSIFDTARQVKTGIYGQRLVLFAPLYISNLCANDCAYCAFRIRNKKLKRRALRQDEIRREVEVLINEGHKRILLVAGESYPAQGLQYVFDAVDSVYSVKSGKSGSIRRVNVNIAPLSVEEFKALKAHNIGTYQIFQETYHLPTYQKMHLAGPKKDYVWRVEAPDRAMQAGIDDVGVGILFGLYDYKFEILGLMEHIAHLESRYGVGPHTVSVPRLEPACGSDVSASPPYPVDDTTFKKIVAILRLAVPYTGIIMSTRETARIRRETFALGVSQLSASSRTNPGGYSENDRDFDQAQFSLGDHRSLDEVIADLAQMGYIPSFCTACYRLGRTGDHFMELAKPGQIKFMCDPNALATFTEYLLDYATPATRDLGTKMISEKLTQIAQTNPQMAQSAQKMITEIESGKRDVYI
ncbi:MAG: [FeFe] hydrogenase H-cluster radical SAM maturase HydG [Planctomycetes bacterium GWF2_50_10]|nr:MAG: [FeFe] hydrogenase H-cluster radical SAM maturase HydG [Planctomycetes bacterium GWF2_50_10]